jgi:hypothetical protein
MTGAFARVVDRVRRGYQGEEDRPLGGYVTVLGLYGGLVTAATVLARALDKRPPERVGVADTVLLGVATHKLSRLVTKEAVTSPLRAPFTRYEEPAGAAEVNESVRGTGAQHAIGELVNCPFCVGVWAASGLTAGLVFAPRLTRLVVSTLSAIAVSDTLQIGYDAAKQHLERLSDK